MVTNEERREVARKLREKHIERNTPGYFEVQDLNFQALNYLKDLEACVPDGNSLFTVLADLIEPDENIVHCRECVHFRPENEQKQTPSRCTGVFAFVEPSDEGFCAWGKKVVDSNIK